LLFEAVHHAIAGREAACSSNDLFLAAAYDDVMAQCYAAMGDSARASQHLIAAERAQPTNLRELQAEHYRSVSVIVRAGGMSMLDEINQRRAQRVRIYHGVRRHKTQVAHDENGIGKQRMAASPEDAALGAANCIAAMFDTAFSPRLLAAEAL